MTNLRPAYLTGDRVYIRALTKADAARAIAWFDSPFPINAASAEEYLTEAHGANQWITNRRVLALCRAENDEVVGGVVQELHRAIEHVLRFHLAPWLPGDEADRLQGEALELLVPWARDELDAMVIHTEVPEDESATRAAAERAGMSATVRLRRFIARPGGRVDLLIYELENPRWEASFA